MNDAIAFVPCAVRQLGGERLLRAAAAALEINPRNRPVVMNRVESLPLDLTDPWLASLLTDRKWETRGVHLSVSFMDDPPIDLILGILAHMNAWGDTANVRFELTRDVGQVRIARAADGHWSYLGTDILLVPDHEPTMNLQAFTLRTPAAELRRVVRHQTGHTLGFPHHHLRRCTIQRLVEWKVVDFYAATQGWSAEQTRAQLLNPFCGSATAGSGEPAHDSIMCYELPASLTANGRPIRGGDDITDADRALAGSCYPAVVSGRRTTGE